MEASLLIFVSIFIGFIAAIYQFYQIQQKSKPLNKYSLYGPFLVLLSFFAIIIYVAFQNYPSNYACSDRIGYARGVTLSFQVNNPTNSLGSPDYRIANVSTETNSILIVDMETNVIADRPGIDFLFYENLLLPNRGLLIDPVIIAVGTEADINNPENFIPVFVWGDDDPSNNGGLPAKYFPERAETLIRQEDLYNLTAIGIDIGQDDLTEYRYVSVKPFPVSRNEPLPVDFGAEVDAIGSINNCNQFINPGN